MGEGAHTVSDEWEQEIERHIYSQANSISRGTPQDCDRAESKVGASQSRAGKEGSVRESQQSPPLRVAGFCRLKGIPSFRERGWDRLYGGQTACRNPASLAVALYWGNWIQPDPNLQVEIAVRFIADGENQTRVEFEHRHLDRYGPRGDEMRRVFETEGGLGPPSSRWLPMPRQQATPSLDGSVDTPALDPQESVSRIIASWNGE